MGSLMPQPERRICRGCGCTDHRACVTDAGPCHWVLLDVETPSGICSACAEAWKWHPGIMAQALCEDAAHVL